MSCCCMEPCHCIRMAGNIATLAISLPFRLSFLHSSCRSIGHSIDLTICIHRNINVSTYPYFSLGAAQALRLVCLLKSAAQDEAFSVASAARCSSKP